MPLLIRRERPRPDAQLSFTDADDRRFLAILIDREGEPLIWNPVSAYAKERQPCLVNDPG